MAPGTRHPIKHDRHTRGFQPLAKVLAIVSRRVQFSRQYVGRCHIAKIRITRASIRLIGNVRHFRQIELPEIVDVIDVQQIAVLELIPRRQALERISA